MRPRRLGQSYAAYYLSRAENLVLILIAVVLTALAVFLLVQAAIILFNSLLHGTVHEEAIEILDSVLLVMMTTEIIYTVTVSLEVRRLRAEPFLVIGAIAAIRRILVITAEGTAFAVSNPEAFRSTLIELGLLALIVVAMALSVFVLRRSGIIDAPGREEKEEDPE